MTLRFQTRRAPPRARRGAVTVLMTAMIISLLVMGAIAIDIAYLQLANTQLRKTADAAAQAGSEALARLQDQDAARAAAKAVALENTVLGSPYTLADSDISLGSVSFSNGAWAFSSGGTSPNAVRINSRVSPTGFHTVFGNVTDVQRLNPTQSATAAHFQRDIVLVLDRSGSMGWDLSGNNWQYPPGRDYCTAPEPNNSRWGVLTKAVTTFVDEINLTPQTEYLGLVTFASNYSDCSRSVSEVSTNASLGTSYGNVTTAMGSISTKAVIGGTAISSGIDRARTILVSNSTRRFADKMIVLLTDGVENVGRSSLSAAEDAAAAKITIHTITYSAGADQDTMAAVAAKTGGNHYHAPNKQALLDIFETIARGIPVVMTQ